MNFNIFDFNKILIFQPLEYTFYLDKMSDLMAMYIDMEIKASR